MASSKAFSLFKFAFLIFLLAFLVPQAISKEEKKPSSPFGFLQHLQGCHKGDKVKGVHDLKKYLENFGYLSYKHVKHNSHSNDDEFDDLLEAAVKTYQLNYNLRPTGTLDAKTVSEMMMPRCGVPDIINGTTRMWSGSKKHHQHGHGSRLHTVGHYSFFRGNPRWPSNKYHLTYAFLPNTPSQATEPVAKAFRTWAANTHFTFSRVQNLRDAALTIGFGRRDHGDGHPFDGNGGTLAHAFAPTDGRFHYDGDESWSVGARPNAFDLETVALHEIGHLLGLGHSSVQGAIMFASIGSGVTKGLHQDDIQGIKALYNV